MKYTKKDFRESTKLKNIWNQVITWHEFTLATVLWHNKPWKVLENGATFDEAKERNYQPIAQFRTQEELWEYIKTL